MALVAQALRLSAQGQIAHDPLALHLHFEFLLERQRVKALGLGEDAVDERLRDAVIGDEVEAQLLARRAELGSRPFERAPLAREIGAEIDHRDPGLGRGVEHSCLLRSRRE